MRDCHCAGPTLLAYVVAPSTSATNKFAPTVEDTPVILDMLTLTRTGRPIFVDSLSVPQHGAATIEAGRVPVAPDRTTAAQTVSPTR